MACFMLIHGVKHWRAAVRPPYCTGMRILKLTVLTMGSVLLAQDQMPTIKVDVDVVNILASVRDKRGALIPSLQKEDFTILEDGKAQPIKYFTKETDLPLTIGLLADEKLKGEVGRKVIVVITDGVDQGSRLTRNQAIEAAQKADAVIYSIDYSDPRAYFGFGGGGGE